MQNEPVCSRGKYRSLRGNRSFRRGTGCIEDQPQRPRFHLAFQSTKMLRLVCDTAALRLAWGKEHLRSNACFLKHLRVRNISFPWLSLTDN
jgi:hypothetical protein